MRFAMTHPTTPNIPIECVRTLVVVAEAGSLSKAADRLGLSQPAVSAQVKRMQMLVGGELFIKTANGATLTELGKLALQQARRILEANDQILGLGGVDSRPLRRIGVAGVLAKRLFESLDKQTQSRIFIHADHSSLIRKGLIEGYIDVACLFSHNGHEPEIEETIVEQHPIPMTWAKSRDFVLSPGAPIPIITLPEDDWLIGALQRKGASYRIVLRTSDHAIRVAALRAGIGLTAMPESVVPADLMKADDYYLPALPVPNVLVCIRKGVDGPDVRDIARKMSAALFGKKDVRKDGRDAVLSVAASAGAIPPA
jgi:DNA-binding transcriptional LysR family regulator